VLPFRKIFLLFEVRICNKIKIFFLSEVRICNKNDLVIYRCNLKKKRNIYLYIVNL